ncbi:hypothetical protein ACOBR2_03355 [Telmatobacter bradus]|uniref:hypothetical protein n=1 Tax=Telmatobacter bradus TaxID=474953 RepID=UPI003B439ECC
MDLLQRALDRVLLQDAELEKIEPRAKPKTLARHWSRAVLMERIAYLKEMARFGNGTEQETVRESPGHAAHLLFRARSGDAELHPHHTHLFVVLTGAATLVSGGMVRNLREADEEKMLGDSIEGGEEQQLRPGDVAHIPAGTPFQMLLTGEQSLSCFAMRLEEPPPE